MKFSMTAVVLALATAVVAAPNSYNTPKSNDLEKNICGQAKMACCNEHFEAVSEEKKAGLLSGVLGTVLNQNNIGLFKQCSKLSVTGLIGVSEILNGGHCKQQIACCQGNELEQKGLVNVGFNCAQVPVAL
ncbi:hypothetical protein AJ79_03929 [Helicocarpus griseus UAMH5409]|uniref:Hydrophobin n=1 Tax=Helicocarpus griseus UAMH5409 TaxID=1447875 RepID=A0A2B7XUR8_9EURO|nr:hypothetical protein AJ79_03929 [Helicocarpus griseus UAMH5409]